MRIQGLGHSCGWGPVSMVGSPAGGEQLRAAPRMGSDGRIPGLPFLGLARERERLGSSTYAVLWNPAVRERVS